MRWRVFVRDGLGVGLGLVVRVVFGDGDGVEVLGGEAWVIVVMVVVNMVIYVEGLYFVWV